MCIHTKTKKNNNTKRKNGKPIAFGNAKQNIRITPNKTRAFLNALTQTHLQNLKPKIIHQVKKHKQNTFLLATFTINLSIFIQKNNNNTKTTYPNTHNINITKYIHHTNKNKEKKNTQRKDKRLNKTNLKRARPTGLAQRENKNKNPITMTTQNTNPSPKILNRTNINTITTKKNNKTNTPYIISTYESNKTKTTKHMTKHKNTTTTPPYKKFQIYRMNNNLNKNQVQTRKHYLTTHKLKHQTNLKYHNKTTTVNNEYAQYTQIESHLITYPTYPLPMLYDDINIHPMSHQKPKEFIQITNPKSPKQTKTNKTPQKRKHPLIITHNQNKNQNNTKYINPKTKQKSKQTQKHTQRNKTHHNIRTLFNIFPLTKSKTTYKNPKQETHNPNKLRTKTTNYLPKNPNSYIKPKKLKTHRQKQQTHTTYNTPIIPTHLHNSILPPKNTLKTNKHKHQYQAQIINKNNQKRARPSGLAQDTTTNIRTRQFRKNPFKNTHAYKQTNKRDTKQPDHTTNTDYTKHCNKKQNPIHTMRGNPHTIHTLPLNRLIIFTQYNTNNNKINTNHSNNHPNNTHNIYKKIKSHPRFVTHSFTINNKISCFFHGVDFAYFYASESVVVRFR